MSIRIFRKSVHHDQPVVALEVDGMVNVNTAPSLVLGNLWMRWLLWRQPVVLVAGSTISSDIFDVRVGARPVDSTTRQLFHPLHAKMTQVHAGSGEPGAEVLLRSPLYVHRKDNLLLETESLEWRRTALNGPGRSWASCVVNA